MEFHRIESFTKGWFIGNFSPSLLATSEFELGVKAFQPWEIEQEHFQIQATEITVITKGSCRMNEKILTKGDIGVVFPGEISKFQALENGCELVVCKWPSIPGDKVLS